MKIKRGGRKERWESKTAEMKQIKQHILKSSELDYRQFVTALRRRARRCGGGGWQPKKQTEKMFRVHL